ncbi:hypothetical protein [Mycobacterium sp.]|uniref:hypothetical protein n=1 Tax=Mycobacterium sp. TaxID=1785 RepID=UPI00260D9662|nr:hypothetical protein [Mycobacterium sp.]
MSPLQHALAALEARRAGLDTRRHRLPGVPALDMVLANLTAQIVEVDEAIRLLEALHERARDTGASGADLAEIVFMLDATPEPDDEPCDRCQGLGSIPQGFSWHADSGEPMPGHTNIPCPDCDGANASKDA